MAYEGMKTKVAMTRLKIFLGVFTAVLWIIGAALSAFGIYSNIKLGNYDLLSSMNYSSAHYILIGIGIFIVLVGFFGCYAIGQGNTCMLRTYAFALGILSIAEVVGAVVVVIYRSRISDSFQDGMMTAIEGYTNSTDYKNAVDQAQSELHCCGVHNFTEYWSAGNWKRPMLPKSCCAANNTVCDGLSKHGIMTLPSEVPAFDLVYVWGCPELLFQAVDSNLGIVLGVLFGVAGFQLLGEILACSLASNINAVAIIGKGQKGPWTPHFKQSVSAYDVLV